MARSVASIFIAPVLCLGLLGGIALENSSHVKPEDAEPYHTKARLAVNTGWPYVIGFWTGRFSSSARFASRSGTARAGWPAAP